MTPERHALLARQLIAACGGLIPAAGGCRLEKSRLADFQDPKSGAFMPIDVVSDLEAYCGEPIYSRALVEDRPWEAEAKSLLTEACETAELAAQIQHLVRIAAEDGRISADERQSIRAQLLELERQLREMHHATDRGPA